MNQTFRKVTICMDDIYPEDVPGLNTYVNIYLNANCTDVQTKCGIDAAACQVETANEAIVADFLGVPEVSGSPVIQAHYTISEEETVTLETANLPGKDLTAIHTSYGWGLINPLGIEVIPCRYNTIDEAIAEVTE